MRRAAISALLVLVCAGVVFAGKEYKAPEASPASTYAAHDAHPKEKVAIAADPYDTPEKLKTFRLKYMEHGLLPVYLVVTNDGDTAMSVASLTAQLTTSDRNSKLSPLDQDDILRRMTKITRSDDVARPDINLPIPHKKVSNMKQEDRDEVMRSRFQLLAVEPHTTRAGFLFFDISGLRYPLPDASLYLSGLQNGDGDPLMYFEIPLDKVLAH